MTVAVVVGLSACASPALPAPALVDPPESTTSEAVATLPGTAATPPTTTAETATSQETTHETRRLAIETITKPLWFGWYAAVAAGDESALGRSVALNRIHADGVLAISTGSLAFTIAPHIDEYRFTVTEVLRDDADCLVVELREDPRAFLIGGIEAERIGVFWRHDGEWFLATSWKTGTPATAWADDCTLMVREFA